MAKDKEISSESQSLKAVFVVVPEIHGKERVSRSIRDRVESSAFR